MIGTDQNPNIGKLTQFRSGKSGNPNGRPKRVKNFSTIIRELQNEQFDWSNFPKKNREV